MPSPSSTVAMNGLLYARNVPAMYKPATCPSAHASFE